MTLKIAERMRMPTDKFQLDFFGGTMFWVRPEALKPLRDLHLAADMPYESGLIDGDLPHALDERLRAELDAALNRNDALVADAARARGEACGAAPRRDG